MGDYASISKISVRYNRILAGCLCIVGGLGFGLVLPHHGMFEETMPLALGFTINVLVRVIVWFPALLGASLFGRPYVTVEQDTLTLRGWWRSEVRKKRYTFDRLVLGQDVITLYLDGQEETIRLRRWMLDRDDLRQLEDLAGAEAEKLVDMEGSP